MAEEVGQNALDHVDAAIAAGNQTVDQICASARSVAIPGHAAYRALKQRAAEGVIDAPADTARNAKVRQKARP